MPRPIRSSELSLRRLRVVSAVLLVTFCLVVAIITFSPGPPDPEGQHALKDFLLRAYTHGLPTFITFDRIESAANVLMFLPIGFFGALALGRARWLIVPAAVCASAGIEIVQALRMPERVGTPKDVIANGLGALLGYLLALLVIAFIRYRSKRRTATRVQPVPADQLALEG
ncbi:MAG: VanZ family protein [Nakamurella sp.]